MRVPATQLRKGDEIEYSSKELGLQSPYVPLQGEIIRIAYTGDGMRITTASGSWSCARNRIYNRLTLSPILGKDSWPIRQNYQATQFKGKSID